MSYNRIADLPVTTSVRRYNKEHFSVSSAVSYSLVSIYWTLDIIYLSIVLDTMADYSKLNEATAPQDGFIAQPYQPGAPVMAKQVHT